MSDYEYEPFGGSKFRPKLSREAKAVIKDAREWLERGRQVQAQREHLRAFGEYLKTEKKESE
jgi:hypothetical protein